MSCLSSPCVVLCFFAYLLLLWIPCSLSSGGKNPRGAPTSRRGGGCPRRRGGMGPLFCGRGGSLPPLIVFWPRSVFLPSLSHLPALSVAYLHARVTPEVKSPGKDVSSELFTGTFTG